MHGTEEEESVTNERVIGESGVMVTSVFVCGMCGWIWTWVLYCNARNELDALKHAIERRRRTVEEFLEG